MISLNLGQRSLANEKSIQFCFQFLGGRCPVVSNSQWLPNAANQRSAR